MTTQVLSFVLRAGADVGRRQHPAADARALGGPAVRAGRPAAGRRRAVRRHGQRLAALAQPRLRAHPALRAHEDRAAADARVVLPEIRGPDQLEGLRRRRGADRRAGLPDQAPAGPGHRAADRRVGLLRAVPGGPVVEGHRRPRGAGRAPPARTSGRTCTTTSASASSRSSIRRATRSAPATTRRRRRSPSVPAA